MDADEERRLQAAALKKAESILAAPANDARALIAVNEALARKSEELKQQREWFEVTLSSIGDAVITTDIHGRVTFMNPVAESMTGGSPGDAKGKSLYDVFHIINEDTRLVLSNPVNKTLQCGTIVGLANHTALVARNGTVISIEDSGAPIRNTNGDIVG